MRRLATAVLVAACVLLPLAAAPVAADTSTTITTTVIEGAGHTYPGGVWGTSDGCETGLSGGEEFRCAFEFDISSLLTSTKVESASLSVRRSGGCTSNDCPVDISSYTGDGSAGTGDVTAGSDILTWTPGASNSVQHFPVTAQIQAHATAGDDWAGFRLTMSSGHQALQDFDISSASKVSLSITYIARPVDVNVFLSYTEVGADGKVTGPAGINCGTACTATFEYLQSITLTAVPLNGATSFVAWQGIACTEGQNSLTCSFKVPTAPPDVNAIFTAAAPTAPPPPTPTPGPTSPHATPRASARASAGATQALSSHAPASAPASGVPTAAASGEPGPTQAAEATFAPGETVGPTLGATEPAAAGGSSPIPIILIGAVVLAIIVGVAVYLFVRRQQGMAPPGA